MRYKDMGKVLVDAKVENLYDVFESGMGKRKPEDVRAVEVRQALVDTGATLLGLPKKHIDHLGLVKFRSRQGRSASGPATFNMYGMVQLTVQGREAKVEVFEVPDDNPVLIGQIPLEILDLVVDPCGQKLIGNPDHGGEQMIEVYSFFPPNG